MKFSRRIFNIINFLVLILSLGFCVYSYIGIFLTCFFSSTTGETGRQAMNFYEFVFWTELITVIASLIARKLWMMCVGAGVVNIFMWTAEAIIWANQYLAPSMTRPIILVLITAVLLGNIIYAVRNGKYRENNIQNLK